jgi:hypothetical protein
MVQTPDEWRQAAQQAAQRGASHPSPAAHWCAQNRAVDDTMVINVQQRTALLGGHAGSSNGGGWEMKV